MSCLSATWELSRKTKFVTIRIRALVGAISREELVSELGCKVWMCLEEAMTGSHVEDVSEQVRGKDIDPPAWGKGKKEKSCDIVANMEARLLKVEVAMAYTREVVHMLEQGIEKDLKDLREEIQDLREGMLCS